MRPFIMGIIPGPGKLTCGKSDFLLTEHIGMKTGKQLSEEKIVWLDMEFEFIFALASNKGCFILFPIKAQMY